MNLRQVATINLHKASVSTTAAGTEVDLAKHFVNPGKREMKAVLTAIHNGVSSDSGTLDYKMQESNTTVDSDFSDISGATFTQLTDSDVSSVEQIHFFTAKRYVRGYATITNVGIYFVAANLFAVKRDA